MSAEPLVQADDVTRVFRGGGGDVVAVDHASLSVARGEFVAVHGRSGSGKTTLLNLRGGLDRPTSGTVRFDGTDLAALAPSDLVSLRRDRLASVFQAFGLMPILSAAENVEIPMRRAAAGRDRPRARQRARPPHRRRADGAARLGHGRTIMELILGLVQSRGLAVVLAMHDPTMISMADRVVESVTGAWWARTRPWAEAGARGRRPTVR